MKELWERIIAWFAANAPPEPDFFSIADGADERDIRSAETLLGLAFPDDVRESYLLHNGSNETGVFENQWLLSVDEVVATWSLCRQGMAYGPFQGLKPPQRVGPIRDCWWSTRWIPITNDGSGDYICIDMDPADGGSVGQVIRTHHEVGPMYVMAPGFRAFLAQFADDLEAGQFWYDENSMMIRRLDQSERPNP
jgi:cell wall assembly regulator SMI1